MAIFSYFFQALALAVNLGLTVYMWIIIARAVLSWVNPDPYNPIVRAINNATEPVLFAVRKRFPLTVSGMDFSPIAVILAIVFLRVFVVKSLYYLSGLFV